MPFSTFRVCTVAPKCLMSLHVTEGPSGWWLLNPSFNICNSYKTWAIFLLSARAAGELCAEFDVAVLPIWVRAEALQMHLKQLRSPRCRPWEGRCSQGLSTSSHQPKV